MLCKYLPIAQIDDSDVVLLHWPYERNLGLKCTIDDVSRVVVLAARVDTVPGPFTLFDINNEFKAVSIGAEWKFDFDAMSIDFEDTMRPVPGSLVITADGPALVSHNRQGRQFISGVGQPATYEGVGGELLFFA